MGLLTLLAYGGVRLNGFVYEDRNWRGILGLGSEPTLTWTGNLFGGDNAVAFHLGNLLLHLVNVSLLGWIAAIVWSIPVAIMASLWFLVHPLNVEAVAYIANRHELLAAFWLLLAIRVGLGWRPKTFHFQAIAVTLCAVAAIASKPSAIAVLALIPAALWVCDSPVLKALGFWWIALGAACIVTAIPILKNPYTFASAYSAIDYAGYQAVAFWSLLGRVIVPTHLSIDHDWISASANLRGVALAGMVYAALVAPAIAVEPWTRIVVYPLLWAVLALAPRFVLRSPELLHEHSFYPVLLGAACAVGLAAQTIYQFVSNRSLPYADR